MSYKGIEMTSQYDYLFSDTQPLNPEFNMEELKTIERKIKQYTEVKSNIGLTAHELETFLDWITFNARSYATRNIPESAITASMSGQCASTQRINCNLLAKMGLDAKSFNTASCIGEIPLTTEDKNRIDNGWFSPAVRHSVSVVTLPMIDANGNTQEYDFLLDPTFRQFCLRENCNESKYYDKTKSRMVAPHPGYFMVSENLIKLGVSEDTAIKTENLAKCIISKGYFYLNEETAKLYGDAFVKASTRIEFGHTPIRMTGRDYINNFKNINMKLLPGNNEDEKFTRLPSEIENKKGLFSKIKEFFQKRILKQKNKTLALPEDTKQLPKGNNRQRDFRNNLKDYTPQAISYQQSDRGNMKKTTNREIKI